jgi:hypothetical protein
MCAAVAALAFLLFYAPYLCYKIRIFTNTISQFYMCAPLSIACRDRDNRFSEIDHPRLETQIIAIQIDAAYYGGCICCCCCC